MQSSLSLAGALRAGLLTFTAALLLAGNIPAGAQSSHKPLVIKAGRILTVTNGTIENGVLVIRDGKIAALGKQGEVTLPPDAEVLDASGMWVMPGQIDLHTHIGNDSGLHDYV